jgi:hypothetical protein
VHYATDHSPFEIIYGFNPLTLLDLIPLVIDEMVGLDGIRKSNMVNKFHKIVWQHLKLTNVAGVLSLN